MISHFKNKTRPSNTHKTGVWRVQNVYTLSIYIHQHIQHTKYIHIFTFMFTQAGENFVARVAVGRVEEGNVLLDKPMINRNNLSLYNVHLGEFDCEYHK